MYANSNDGNPGRNRGPEKERAWRMPPWLRWLLGHLAQELIRTAVKWLIG